MRKVFLAEVMGISSNIIDVRPTLQADTELIRVCHARLHVHSAALPQWAACRHGQGIGKRRKASLWTNAQMVAI
jgi:hypothetical protein